MEICLNGRVADTSAGANVTSGMFPGEMNDFEPCMILIK